LANVLRRANARKREESAKKKNVNTRPVASAERVRESARAGKMSFVGKMQKRRPREYFTNGSQPSRAKQLALSLRKTLLKTSCARAEPMDMMVIKVAPTP
jgi:hypothetical protein